MKLSENCFAVLGLACYPPWVVNAGFIVGTKRTMVIDSSASYLTAQTIYGYAKNVKPENEIILVNTEKHLDHIGGNCFFAEKGVEIFAHPLNKRKQDDLNADVEFYNSCIQEKVRRDAHEEKVFYNNTVITNANNELVDSQIIDLGNLEAKIIYTPGHTDTNISIYVEKDKVLFTGDAIVKGYIPNLECGDINSWREWTHTLEKIDSLNLFSLVPGHGRVLFNNEIKEQIDLVKQIILKAIQVGKAPTICE